MRQYILLIFLFSIGQFYSSAQENSSTWIWQISGGDLQKKSYILGTLPLQDSLAYQFPDKTWGYLDKTDVFVLIAEKNPSLANQVISKSYSTFERNYNTKPNEYIRSIADGQQKPVITLNSNYSISNFYTQDTKPKNPALARDAMDDYLSAKIEDLAEVRKNLDVPANILTQIGAKTNYELLNDLVRYMQLQPVFFAVDATYLGGNNGLIELFRARGFKVKPVEEKYYAKKAEEIDYRNMMQAQWENQQNAMSPGNYQTQQPTNQPSTNAVMVPTQPTANVKLDLPTGILNLNQWSEYEIGDSLIIYHAPVKLKKDGERPQTYSASYGGLDYSIEAVEQWKNTNEGVEKVVIKNGGQLVSDGKFNNGTVSGEQIELMYAENQVSKHLLVEGIGENYIVSVRGSTPEIYSVVANDFLKSFRLRNLNAMQANSGNSQVTPIPQMVTWAAIHDKRASLNFPSDYKRETTELEDGRTVTSYSSSKGIDENTYVFVVSQRDTFDNFKLFNDAINTVSQEVRGVIKDRHVMENGATDRAEYTIEDAVGNQYRVLFLYDGKNFYQLYAKGDGKSVENITANTIFQSIFIN